MIVTDFQWKDERMSKDPVKYPMWICNQKWNSNYGKPVNRIGFYMDEFLALNLNALPNYLKNAWDAVGIISGHGKVRIGKTLKGLTPTLMADGNWKRADEVRIGDKVLSPNINNGKHSTANVIEVHSRWDDDCYDVISNKTGEVLYTCAGNHDIPVEYNRNIKESVTGPDGKRKYLGFEKMKVTMEARDLFKKSRKWMLNQSLGTYQGFVIEKFDGVENPTLDGYALGYFIGNGWFSKNSVSLSCNNPECISEIPFEIMSIFCIKRTTCKNYNYSASSTYSKQLLKLGFKNCKSGTKFIPRAALRADKQYRLRLLAGLIDSDGYLNNKNNIVYTSKSKQLIKDIQELVRSLGGTASLKKKTKTIKKINFSGTYYDCSINLGPLAKEIPVVNKLKAERLAKNNSPRLTLVGIHLKKAKPQMVYGFELDSESHLYITNEYCITHNSSIAQQVGLYLAWLIAGGKMKQREDWMKGEPNKFVVHRAPKRIVRFDLQENIVFSPEQLMTKAGDLYKKYGKHQVIIYDEGRAGLDSAKAMSAINKAMQDFFQECGMYGHIILIVLPSFFKLHEDYATARTLFLIDVYANKEMRRGFFNFYNEQQKEYLYLQGKKMVGTIGKYKAGFNSFSGRFTKFLPFDKDEYEAEKMKALSEKVVMGKRDAKFMAQRDHALWMIQQMNNPSREALANYLGTLFEPPLKLEGIGRAIDKEEQEMKDKHGLKNLRIIKRNLIRIKDSEYGVKNKVLDDMEDLV